MTTLKSKRIFLRPFTKEDLNDLHKITSNEKVASLAGFRKRNNLKETQAILDCFVKEPADNLWAIVHNNTNTVIGWIEMHNPVEDIYVNAKEIGFVLTENYWGQALIPETIKLLLHYAFHELNTPTVICAHFKNNTQSKKAIEKCNFKYDGEYNNKFYYILKNNNQNSILTT